MGLGNGTIAQEARAFGADVVDRLEQVVSGLEDLKLEEAQDEASFTRANGNSGSSKEVVIEAVTVPQGAVWVTERIAVATDGKKISEIALYLGSVSPANFIGMAEGFEGNGESDDKYVIRGPITVPGQNVLILVVKTVDEDVDVFSVASVQMLGGMD